MLRYICRYTARDRLTFVIFCVPVVFVGAGVYKPHRYVCRVKGCGMQLTSSHYERRRHYRQVHCDVAFCCKVGRCEYAAVDESAFVNHIRKGHGDMLARNHLEGVAAAYIVGAFAMSRRPREAAAGDGEPEEQQAQEKRPSPSPSPSVSVQKTKRDISQFICTFDGCARRFMSRHNLANHWLEDHLGVRYPCREPNCKKSPKNATNLFTHLTRTHKRIIPKSYMTGNAARSTAGEAAVVGRVSPSRNANGGDDASTAVSAPGANELGSAPSPSSSPPRHRVGLPGDNSALTPCPHELCDFKDIRLRTRRHYLVVHTMLDAIIYSAHAMEETSWQRQFERTKVTGLKCVCCFLFSVLFFLFSFFVALRCVSLLFEFNSNVFSRR